MSRVKGSPKTGGRKKGSLNKTTLDKLARRAIFEEEVSEVWRNTIKQLKPEYIADQFMGKAPDELKVTGELEVKTDPKLLAIANEYEKKLKESQ